MHDENIYESPGNFTFPSDILIPTAAYRSTRATTVTTNSFTVPFAHTLSFKTSFVPRTLCMWNSLGTEYTSKSVNSFLSMLKCILL